MWFIVMILTVLDAIGAVKYDLIYVTFPLIMFWADRGKKWALLDMLYYVNHLIVFYEILLSSGIEPKCKNVLRVKFLPKKFKNSQDRNSRKCFQLLEINEKNVIPSYPI